MPDIVQRGAVRGGLDVDRRVAPNEATGCRRDQSREKPKKTGLAATVWTGQQQCFARRQAKRYAGEDKALAPPASEILSDQDGGKARQRYWQSAL